MVIEQIIIFYVRLRLQLLGYYLIFQHQMLVAETNGVFSIVKSVNIKYFTYVMSNYQPSANNIIEIIDDNPLASPIFLNMEISIWSNAI